MSGDHDPPPPEWRSNDDAGAEDARRRRPSDRRTDSGPTLVDVLEFAIMIAVVSVGAAALYLLIGRIAQFLIGIAIIAVIIWGSRNRGSSGRRDDPDRGAAGPS